MIDFNNSVIFKLQRTDILTVSSEIEPLLVKDEQLLSAYKGFRDYIVFTNKRVIAVNVQGITGRKKDFTSLPFSKVQAFSCETAGTLDLDSELELYYSELGKVKFEFTGETNITEISQIIASYVL